MIVFREHDSGGKAGIGKYYFAMISIFNLHDFKLRADICCPEKET